MRVKLIETDKGFSTYAYTADVPGSCLPALPAMAIAKRPRTQVGRNGYRVAGWAVVIGGREIGRERTKRAARVVLDNWLTTRIAEIDPVRH
jgi:hypothetical protein